MARVELVPWSIASKMSSGTASLFLSGLEASPRRWRIAAREFGASVNDCPAPSADSVRGHWSAVPGQLTIYKTNAYMDRSGGTALALHELGLPRAMAHAALLTGDDRNGVGGQLGLRQRPQGSVRARVDARRVLAGRRLSARCGHRGQTPGARSMAAPGVGRRVGHARARGLRKHT